MGDITYQNKDVASKTMAEALRGKTLAAFGLPHVKIIGILPTNLPAVESNELRLDNLFLLDDCSVALLDYESVFDKENFVKYINYIARVIKRYAIQKQLQALAGILTFSDQVIDKAYKKRIKEEMQMTQIGQMLIDEGMERGVEVGMERGMERIITSMLRKQKSIEDIHNDTDIPVELIQKVKDALE